MPKIVYEILRPFPRRVQTAVKQVRAA
jgi:hypothetical protein